MSTKQAELSAQLASNLSIVLGQMEMLEQQIQTMQATIETITAENVALKAATNA